jgi:hypothetical protein
MREVIIPTENGRARIQLAVEPDRVLLREGLTSPWGKLTPTKARHLADLLRRAADEAEQEAREAA